MWGMSCECGECHVNVENIMRNMGNVMLKCGECHVEIWGISC